ncbi:serine hydrolase domain-containing protein [Fimbriimonas ginsengisoli]|uniref:Beta-lactamase n=1 Tax=Fimbriimonas ginsengisoli Gsoil 348 TaxID=661478 RepID=A0A068NN86_FIMGI|nr:serine hydrolase domain-containing protein [Fimbriimonas ginsengisoli]AIE84921.1 beta-lactamase [Fimbriimonas ginsengisoli Gsoil 348]
MSDLPTSLAEFELRLRAAIDPVALPSIAYGIARGDETLLLGAAGVADKGAARAAFPFTPYSLASITKPMTATAVVLLAEGGLVDLDAPINRYLGDAKVEGKVGDAEAATVRRVANHSAGLPLHYQFFYADEPYRPPAMDETIRRYGKLFSTPGERHHYSNLGYGLLDYLVERISGRSYAEFMRDEVFLPLGMAGSSIGATHSAATRYSPEGWAYPDYDFDHPGGSAAFSSVEDLLAFGRFHLGNGPSLLSFAALNEMQRATVQIEGDRGYGFGWAVNEDRLGYRTVGHTGSMGGVSTILRLVPSLDLVIAVLTNGESPLANRAADEALAAVSPEFRARLAAESEGLVSPIQSVPPEWARKWNGSIETYAGNRRLELDITGPHSATATLDGSSHAVEEVQLREGRLLGVFDGDIGTEDAGRRPYRIHLELKLQSTERLEGAAVTVSKREKGERMGNALAYFVTLNTRY